MEHQTRLTLDEQANEADHHRTKSTTNIQYTNLGDDSIESVAKTLINFLILLRTLARTPSTIPNSQVSALTNILSSLVDTTYHVTASAPRRTSFQAIPKAVPYILQVAATTVAAVADISHNPEIRHAILHGQPIYDNHPAFDDFYNSCRTVNNINADI
jgi:hypothetical protein